MHTYTICMNTQMYTSICKHIHIGTRAGEHTHTHAHTHEYMRQATMQN